MRVNFKFRNYKITKLQNSLPRSSTPQTFLFLNSLSRSSRQHSQRGYMLITLMLGVALIAIAMLAMLPDLAQQIKRDREEEMRHRGTSYMRAIQRYYKKFGKYPSRIEELENTNNIRFLRKRYKDPITGKDFKILHPQDIHINNGPVLGQIPGAGGLPGQPGQPGQAGALTQLAQQMAGGLTQAQPQPTLQKNEDDESESGNPANPKGAAGAAAAGGDEDSEKPAAAGGSDSGAGAGFGSTVFGGGPIVGVQSPSKAKSIREFNSKNHYNDWYFIYDPTADRGGLLVGPWQPASVQGMKGGAGLGQSVQGIVQGQGGGLPNNGPIQTPQQQPQTPPQNPGENSPPDQ